MSFLALLIFSMGMGLSAQENIFVLKDSYIYPKKKFIDSLAVAEAVVKPYETFATSSATIRSGRDKNYQVRLSKFAGGTYPGDFQAIQIFLGNKCLLEVTNADGWTSLPPNVPSNNNYYFTVNISPYSTALFFFSQAKDNFPPDLTIVVIKTGKAHLVYHRPCVLQSISKNSYSVRLEMDDRYPVYVVPGATSSEVTTEPEEPVVEEQQAEPQAQPKKKRNPKSVPVWKPERFEAFWSYYPRHEDRVSAVREWDRLKPEDGLIDTIARALKRQVQNKDWAVPYACRYLRNQRWLDELPKDGRAAPARPRARQLTGWHTEVIDGEEVLVEDG